MTSEDSSGDVEHADHEHNPKGTLVLMFIFLGVIAATWIWMYLILLSRG